MASKPSNKKGRERKGISFAVTFGVMVLVIAVLLWRGGGFYLLDLDQRPEHAEFRDLRPSGNVGYGYGIVGTILIFTNLLYLARRKFAARRLGSMKTWLDLHVFTGLVGATFISFHSAFQVRSIPSQITAISLTVVVITGLIGRFFYALSRRPDTRNFKEAVQELEQLLPGVGTPVTQAVTAYPVPSTRGDPSLLRTFRTLPAWRRNARQRYEAVELVVLNLPQVRNLDPSRQAQVRKLTHRVGRAAAADAYGVAGDSMLRAWRPMHRLFALLMLCTVVFHIGVALYYGYHWIFTSE